MAVLSPSVKKIYGKSVAGSPDQKSLYTGPIDTTWPPKTRVGRGFNNTGNTCFLNSALQCLLHTAPLVRILMSHKKETCMFRFRVRALLYSRIDVFRSTEGHFLHDMCNETDNARRPDENHFNPAIPYHHKITAYVEAPTLS